MLDSLIYFLHCDSYDWNMTLFYPTLYYTVGLLLTAHVKNEKQVSMVQQITLIHMFVLYVVSVIYNNCHIYLY